MKLVINTCYGGFSLSPEGIALLAKKQGRKCYFYEIVNGKFAEKFTPVKMGEISNYSFVFAFDSPNINKILPKYTSGNTVETIAYNKALESHGIDSRPDNRADPLLVQVVEELGEKANGAYANLAVVEIPDGVDWEIDEYDGVETVHEKHRSWS